MRGKGYMYRFSGAVGVHWRLNRAILIWLLLFVFAGVCIGCSVAFNARIKVDHISQSLLDTNLLRVVRPTASIGGIMIGRVFSFAVMIGFIFVLCLNRWTSFLAFGVATYQGFNIVINLYWIIARFGVATGAVLFFIYGLMLIILTILTVIAIVFCLRVTEPCRCGGMRGGIKWRDLKSQIVYFAAAITIFSFVEWLWFMLILSKIVFIV